MKRLLTLAAVASLALMAACAAPPMSTAAPGAPPMATAAPTLDSRIGVAVQEVTIARQAATSLLQAGKITVAQDQKLQTDLDAVRAVLASSEGLSLTDPAQAAQLLSTALAQLATIQGAKP